MLNAMAWPSLSPASLAAASASSAARFAPPGSPLARSTAAAAQIAPALSLPLEIRTSSLAARRASSRSFFAQFALIRVVSTEASISLLPPSRQRSSAVLAIFTAALGSPQAMEALAEATRAAAWPPLSLAFSKASRAFVAAANAWLAVSVFASGARSPSSFRPSPLPATAATLFFPIVLAATSTSVVILMASCSSSLERYIVMIASFMA
mmetsp:Transcript_52532/g.112347  ORF Transcript_52532/g.112347 Transcript_52532/m.112347 type:complete len:209 (-) Transcript_52532:137-763(-)